ncbi:MAG: tyrosine-type recombinase/integrase [Anaerolineales bacterium]|nr:tyrosine-type recombinase/integrase [Anaerolineales bacterium]
MKSNVSRNQSVDITFRWENGHLVKVITKYPHIDHFLNLIKTTRSYNTWVNYAHDLKVFFTYVPKPPIMISRKDCVEFIMQQDKEGYSDATINRRLACLSSFFNELKFMEGFEDFRNPIYPRMNLSKNQQRNFGLYRRRGKRIPTIFTEEEIYLLLDSLRTWRDRTIVMLMWISCLRVSEVVSIRFDDLEFSHRRIHIPVSKNHNARMVFMDSPTFRVLNRYLDEERQFQFPNIEHIFVGFKGKAKGKPFSVNAVQKMVKYYGDKCGIFNVHAHRFRHTGITRLVQQGMAEPVIRKFVGHSNPGSLTPYLHLSDEYVAKEFEKTYGAFQIYTGFQKGD